MPNVVHTISVQHHWQIYKELSTASTIELQQPLGREGASFKPGPADHDDAKQCQVAAKSTHLTRP